MVYENPVALSVIIPVLNEAENIRHLYDEIVTALPAESCALEVVFVDDGSTDGTRALLAEMAASDSRVRVVLHVRNYGQSAALVSGARAAMHPLLVTLDGDGQNDPADIPRLLEARTHARAIVLGNRARRQDNGLRRLSSRIGNGIRNAILKDGCPDTGCSLKLFPRDAFLALPHFNHLHRYLPALFLRAGFQLLNVPVNHRPRQFGVSKYGVMNRLFVGMRDLIGVRWLMARPCSPEVIDA
ncbi:glycosyl transferase, group 2 family protein [Legionella geestiana]|uniref:Glycosyl transferase, group 2 family protein n=1 Tax=Legionella geestiana TaxID=45065 RepID=A0A0W0TYY6_9GAMM|nr:glycosyltransferase family 2 protein [Legionella geestiana]KTD00671.1 glycosyl transferase, group 2 family protein [Legionella geestiana]QBS11716.1 glycosyltransferase family 2 protein [Legionella geestiana]QDQ40672.1 glycosyltransferase family 2 protein [Legionella geestiana]STX53596.1 glycosyl transferase, group 2 family protein [Legionella geestiana]